ncbi:hypothetical protein ACFE04_008224 [Oxalis oulophora]
MATCSSSLILCVLATLLVATTANFYQNIDITWGNGRGKVLNNGNLLTLSLDKESGSGFQSKNQFIYGKVDMKIKLVPGNSAGTLKSEGTTWDELDFEFLGNLSGDPYIMHTNVFSQGKGNREQQFYLCFYVDGTPIREFKNLESQGIAYPKSQPMRVYSTLWNADDWATRGGLVKTDWSKAPFTASYMNLNANGCVWSKGKSSCGSGSTTWSNQELDSSAQQRLNWVKKNYMIYNYCTDTKRFPLGIPKECSINA